MNRFGYACQNLTLGLSTGRTLRLANVPHESRVRDVVATNLSALEEILRWNREHGIQVFRLSQQLIPFASHPAFPYPWEDAHRQTLQRIGEIARSSGSRLSLHPGQFIQPASPNEGVASRSIAELRYVARLLSLLGSENSVMVLHLGGAYGDKHTAGPAFVRALDGEVEILSRLALENDERVWTVEDVVDVARDLEVPVIVDTLHHRLNSGGLPLQGALHLALHTWRGRPKVHLSSQDPEKQAGAHAWGVTAEDFRALHTALGDTNADIMIEAKGKDKAVLEIMQLSQAA